MAFVRIIIIKVRQGPDLRDRDLAEVFLFGNREKQVTSNGSLLSIGGVVSVRI